MSVRRLAAAEVQPESFTFSKESEKKIAFWMNKYPEDRKASAVIPLLWLAQKQEGWVSEPALREIAARCEMPYIRVYEVATFYTMFNLEPVGEHLIQVCGTTPCWLRGADDLKAVCEKRIGKKGRGNVSADGKFSWEEVECLGACSNAPMVQIANKDGDYYYEDLTGAALEQILDDLAAGKPVEMGPVTGRKCSEPVEADVAVLTAAELYDGSRAKPMPYLPNTPEAKAAAEKGEDPDPVKKGRPAQKAPDADESGGAVKSAPRKTAKAVAKTAPAKKPAAKTAAKKPAAKKPAAKKPATKKDAE
ncbi:NADH dehydrogenase subunit E [Glycocaulis alkaliphilus]|uniref:NADH dehydrogenase subunit E n=1 Tax=Glycocaulis alkaliphilus TaxID=1434191 RepID=A0A3T0EAI3_9PROT|nr:NADH-quinone oxidoreductase subunit NuoE [Glycocaulis alkaliphilus]AZU04329.1 NADH dehydrogenase subunit E [Glycocaulis alkaliphilus]GGB77551.1 NADH-quinone oxidoreductase subunit E [Glycocaulis alkaliphilus]